jgi:hypothetical protein
LLVCHADQLILRRRQQRHDVSGIDDRCAGARSCSDGRLSVLSAGLLPVPVLPSAPHTTADSAAATPGDRAEPARRAPGGGASTAPPHSADRGDAADCAESPPRRFGTGLRSACAGCRDSSGSDRQTVRDGPAGWRRHEGQRNRLFGVGAQCGKTRDDDAGSGHRRAGHEGERHGCGCRAITGRRAIARCSRTREGTLAGSCGGC